jgi:hypothetical protein
MLDGAWKSDMLLRYSECNRKNHSDSSFDGLDRVATAPLPHLLLLCSGPGTEWIDSKPVTIDVLGTS